MFHGLTGGKYRFFRGCGICCWKAKELQLMLTPLVLNPGKALGKKIEW
jgi:hypothetical protein